MEMIPLVILAGYSEKSRLLSKLAIGFSYIFNQERYLWDVEKSVMLLRDKQGNERSILEIMLDNVSDSERIGETIYVVGTENVEKIVNRYHNNSKNFVFVPQRDSIGENMQFGYETVQRSLGIKGYAMFLTSDLPKVHGKDIDELLEDVDFSSPLILSYIKAESFTELKRRFFPLYDEKKFRAKESNIVLGNAEADFLAFNKLYHIRKMMNPDNWIKAIKLYAHETGYKGFTHVLGKVVKDYFTKRAVDFEMAISVIEKLVGQKTTFYEVKNSVFNMDVDSTRDLNEMGYGRI